MSDVVDRAAEIIESNVWVDGEHLAQALDDAGVLATTEHDEQVRADGWAQLAEADFIAYGVERGWLEEKVRPEFHYPGGVEPAVRQFVTKGEELPLTPPPTPEEIEVLKRRLAGLEP